MDTKEIKVLVEHEFRVELVAQALFLRQFGLTHIVDSWLHFAEEKPESADELRKKAEEMLAAAAPHKHHSLGWVFNA